MTSRAPARGAELCRRALASAVLASLVLGVGCAGRGPRAPWRLYWWYAEPPSGAEQAALRDLGVGLLYVRIAEVRRQGQGLQVDRVLPRPFRVPGISVVPVVRVGHDVSGSGDLPWDDLARVLADFAASSHPGEMHLDFDVPTAALDRYAALLREQGAGRGPVSTTALLAWFEAGRQRGLVDGGAGVVLLAYGGRLPASAGGFHDTAEMGRLRRLASRIREGPPVVVGLPAYGEGWVWRGSSREQYLTGFDLDELSAHPDLSVANAPASPPGSLCHAITFHTHRAVLVGGLFVPAGRDLLAVAPRAAGLGEAAREVEALLGHALTAIAVHRASRGEAGGLTLEVRVAARGGPPPVGLATTRSGKDITITLQMPRGRRSDIPGGARVELAWEAPGATWEGSFDASRAFGLVEGRLARAEPRRATRLHLEEAYLAPGEEARARVTLAERSGELRLDVELVLEGEVRRRSVEVSEGSQRTPIP